MSDLKVSDTTVPGILDSLRKGEWLVPHFQREFVWSSDQVAALVQSVLEARPIGMVTLWEQQDVPGLPLERISLADQDPVTKQPDVVYFGEGANAAKKFALLDGRQRCTAIAIAFGGFRASTAQYRHSGRYYLDVKQADSRKRVKFIRAADVFKQGLESDGACVGKGLFPLASSIPGEATLMQWMRYLQALGNADFYPPGQMPGADELARRNRILQDAFEGIVKTKMAVYTVPEKYSLADICDIFETLNTTGTKVSTVDLIHSWLYSDTVLDPEGPFLLREWIRDLGQIDGAIGWSSADDRPELIVQIVTACYVALLSRAAPPRSVSASRLEPITSVKSGDLLATPAQHWKHIRSNEGRFAAIIGCAQRAVARGFFPWQQSPYPVSLSIYVALRYHLEFDEGVSHQWRAEDLDALFRAFFWRNALTRRYDQGFLSQVGTDIQSLRTILVSRSNYATPGEWAKAATTQLDMLFEYPIPSREELIDSLTDGTHGGAFQKALTLPMLARARSDIVNPDVPLAFPSSTVVELHHIYPREWCRNNQSGDLRQVLDKNLAQRDFVNCVANLMPLSRQSNNAWRQKYPAQFLTEKSVTFEHNRENLERLFIDKYGFDLLMSGPEKMQVFLQHRAQLIADELLENVKVVF